MRKTPHSSNLLFAILCIASSFAVVRAQQPAKEIVLLKINKEHDKRTVIRPSTIPNAGNGLFALVKSKKEK